MTILQLKILQHKMTILQLKGTKTAERTHLEKTTILLITCVGDASVYMDFSKKY